MDNLIVVLNDTSKTFTVLQGAVLDLDEIARYEIESGYKYEPGLPAVRPTPNNDDEWVYDSGPLKVR